MSIGSLFIISEPRSAAQTYVFYSYNIVMYFLKKTPYVWLEKANPVLSITLIMIYARDACRTCCAGPSYSTVNVGSYMGRCRLAEVSPSNFML